MKDSEEELTETTETTETTEPATFALALAAKKARNAAMDVIALIAADPESDISEVPWLIGRLGMAMLEWNEVVSMIWTDTVGRTTQIIRRAEESYRDSDHTFGVIKVTDPVKKAYALFASASEDALRCAKVWRET